MSDTGGLPPLPGARTAGPSPASPPSPPPPPSPEDGADLPMEVPHDLSRRVEGLSCPNCGGNLEIDTGLRVVACPYCETPLLVLSEIGVRRFAVEPRIEAGRAREIARGWLHKGMNKDKRLRKEARLGEAFLCFLPFFRVEADAIGFALGTEKRRRTTGSGKHRRVETYEVDVERKLQRSFDRTYPAVNVAEWGIQKVDLSGDPLQAFDDDSLARQGMVFPPTGSARDVFNAAIETFRKSAEPTSGLHRVRFRFQEILRQRLSIVYYPLWVVRYHFQERAYQVLVDAENGTLAYGKAPGNDLYRALALVATEAAAMFVATTALQFFGGGLPVLLFAGVIGLGLVWWGWKRFRYGGVVIEGSGTKGGDDLKAALAKASSMSTEASDMLMTLSSYSQAARHLQLGRRRGWW